MSESHPDWNAIGQEALASGLKGAALGSVVPGVGTVVGGLIGVASNLVSHILPPSAQPALTAAAEAITGKAYEATQLSALAENPAQMAEFRLQVMQIVADEHTAERQADADRLAAALADVANARAQTIALAAAGSRIAWGTPVTSVVVLMIFAMAVSVILFWGIPPGSEATANVLLGTLATMAVSVVSYWVGSSAGSAEKQRLLAGGKPDA